MYKDSKGEAVLCRMRVHAKSIHYMGLAILAMIAFSCGRREPELIPRATLFDNPVKTHPSNSPDGTKMAYLAPLGGALNIYIKTIGRNDDRPLTKETERSITRYIWARNNKQILYVQDHSGMEDYRLFGVDLETGRIRDYTPFDSLIVGIIARWDHRPNTVLISMNRDNPRRFDAYLLDLVTGELRLAARNPGNIIRWYADTSFAVRGSLRADPDGGSTLLVRATERDPWRPLRRWTFEEGAVSGPLRFTQDGSAMYCIDGIGANAGRLVTISLSDSSVTVIAGHPRYDISAIWLDPRTHLVQAVFFAGERSECRVIDPGIQPDVDALSKLDEGDFGISSRDSSSDSWIVHYTKDNGPVSYYAYDRKSRQGVFLFDDKPDLRNYELARMEPITITARDGLELPAYITFPPGARRRALPLVLLVHGGLWNRDFWGFNPEVQWLANRGYVCLQVNHRGSAGYGKDFTNAGNREWGGVMQDDLMDAVDWAVSAGIADPKRIGIFGASYGGYAVLSALADEPERFRCGVEVGGVMDLVAWLTNLPPYWTQYRKELNLRVGDPVADAQMLFERSPINKADRITAPLMLVHGGYDKGSPPEEAERIISSLRARGVPNEYILFPDEGHILAKPKNKLRFYEAAERFLAAYLGGRYEEAATR